VIVHDVLEGGPFAAARTAQVQQTHR
jgi:hypothetical protein